jgi:hypothetical protein
MNVKHMQLFCYVILMAHFLNIGFSNPLPAEAGHRTAPVHYISMEFDLQSNSLTANSRIELPAGLKLHLSMSHLNVSQIIINGQPAEAGQGNDDLDIPSSPREQEILLSYSKEIPPDSSPGNIISPSGITLIDSWYPVADHEMLFKLTAHIPVAF